jgi:N-ethylmaleimide reductase
MAEYYAQRTSPGALLIGEATIAAANGNGYLGAPGLYDDSQIAGWREVTDAVHAKGGRMFAQFMHVGRIGHAANRYTKEPLVAPSAIHADGLMWTDAMQMQPNDKPRELALHEIPGVVEEYSTATKNAMAAGFDGVELHSASGYLPMQFLSSNTNQRTDAYGGHVNNRIKFVVDTLEAMSTAAGSASKVGIKISPAMPFNDIHDADPVETYTTLVKAIGSMGLAYLHVMQSAPDPNYFAMLRPLFKGPLAAGAGFTKESGAALLGAGGADFIVYGTLFVANPDLPARFQKGAPLNAPDPNTFYGGGETGYTDYKSL